MQWSLFFPWKSNLLQLFSQLDMIMYLSILLTRKIHCLLLRAETPQWCLGRVRCLSPGFTKATPLSRKQPGSQLKPLPRTCVGCRLTSQVRMLSPNLPSWEVTIMALTLWMWLDEGIATEPLFPSHKEVEAIPWSTGDIDYYLSPVDSPWCDL